VASTVGDGFEFLAFRLSWRKKRKTEHKAMSFLDHSLGEFMLLLGKRDSSFSPIPHDLIHSCTFFTIAYDESFSGTLLDISWFESIRASGFFLAYDTCDNLLGRCFFLSK